MDFQFTLELIVRYKDTKEKAEGFYIGTDGKIYDFDFGGGCVREDLEWGIDAYNQEYDT